MPIIEFDTKMRGYDPQQVNDAVTNFQDTINKYAQANTDLKRTLDTVNNQFTQANQDIDQLQAENKKLSERIEELEKQNDDLEAKIKNKYTSVGDDVRKLLEDTQTVYHAAEKNAADIKNKALQEADSIRKQSQSAAEKTMVDARQVAEKNVKESQAKSKQIIESAQQSAAQLRKEADSYATGRQNIAEQADARVRAILGRLQEASKVLDNAYQSGRKPNATTVQSAPKDAPTPVIAGQATDPNEADLEDDRTIAFAQIHAKNTASAPATPVDAQ